jgi:hypothetical protein
MLKLVLALAAGAALATWLLQPVKAAGRFSMDNQGSGIYTISDAKSGACFLMVDRGGSASVTQAPEGACH